MNGIVPRRFPLYAKILLLLALNVALLGLAVFLLARAQFGLGRDWPLSAGANARIDATCDLMLAELNAAPRTNWTAALRQLSDSYRGRVSFLVFGDGCQLAGPALTLPPEVAQRVEDHHGHPPFHHGPPLAEDGPGGPPLEPPDGPPPRDPRPKSMAHTSHPSRYWVVVPALLRNDGRPMPVRLVVMSDTLSGGGLLFDWKPWLIIGAGALLLTALLWLPLAIGINRSISQMTLATGRLAEGQFDVRVNERRRDELGALGHAINQMAGRIAGLVGGQKRFLGDVAHELCSPLAKLRIALGILDQRAPDQDREYVAQADEEAGRIAELVNELLSFSKAALGPSKTRLSPVALADVAAEAVRREQKDGAEVIVEIDPALRAQAEPQLLTRALANLVRNAVAYAGDGGPITISARATPGAVSIAVADSGPGVPEAELAKIFDPFYRVDTSRARETGGVGLGLAIVKTCVEACSGTVTCRNRAPHGLEVTLSLQPCPEASRP
jgi:two-component system sensor histidine kinase CpxA